MEHILKNGIDIILNNKKNTPRTSVYFYFKIDKPEKYSGTYGLFAKLLLQGTKTKDSKTLAQELENECIDVSIKTKQDYLKVSFLFLNEDFKRAMNYAQDILLNSTFDEFEKELYKVKGELKSDLDNPRILATDTFVRNVFSGHYYSNTATKTLEEIDNIKKEDMFEIHKQILNSKKVISIAGDINDPQEIAQYFADNFDFMKSNETESQIQKIDKLNDENAKIIKISKNDLNQAQLFQGWIVPNMQSELYPKISLMNNILGASGLSSRLFVELRDKQGLAYTVRSSYETLSKSALFSFYIATEPKNIKKSLDGFMFELKKIADNQPSQEEIQGGKENIIGRLEYFSQTNSQLASMEGYNYLMGLGLNYSEKFIEEINKTNANDVCEAARYILGKKSLICALAPEKFLEF